MTQPSETGATPPQSWAELFIAAHPLEQLPTEARIAFSDFIDHRQAILDIYQDIPSEQFHQGIGAGDSPKKELVHQIGNSIVRQNALRNGSISSWNYQDIDPAGQKHLQELSKEELLEGFRWTAETLYELITPDTISRTLALPYGKTASGLDSLWGAVRHEVLHLGMAIKFGDHFGVPRPASVKKLYG